MVDEKGIKKLNELCIKIQNVFTDIYILEQGYVITMDSEKPFMISMEEDQIQLFKDLYGEFKLLHIWDLRKFKKYLVTPEDEDDSWENYIVKVASKSEEDRVIQRVSDYVNNINKCTEWDRFILSDDDIENNHLMDLLFLNNGYVEFFPKNTKEYNEIILTKSLLPLVSKKNYTELMYSVEKINSNLFLIVFDFEFSLFRLYMLHYYIPIEEVK